MKYLLAICFTVFMFCQGVIGYAAEEFDVEDTVDIGSYFGVQAEDVHFTILQGTADVVIKDGSECLLFTQTGDVLVNANFSIPTFSAERMNLRYLLHVQGSEAQIKALHHNEKPADFEQFPEQILRLVNLERAKVGARPLRLAAELQSGARLRAQEITKLFSHTRPDGSHCNTVLANPYGVGENIAAGSKTAVEVMDSWMHSPGHRRNILDTRYKELGVGYCYAPDGVGGYVHYWVQMFRF